MSIPWAGVLPLYAASAVHQEGIHLVASGPDLIGTHPDRLPPATLCGHAAGAALAIGAGDITCERCLQRAPEFMHRPGWSTPR